MTYFVEGLPISIQLDKAVANNIHNVWLFSLQCYLLIRNATVRVIREYERGTENGETSDLIRNMHA